MLMRSMPSEYSPKRSSGITTSSFTLKALVCLAIAAVLDRSNQNNLRCSAVLAIKPSPLLALASSTICRAALSTSFSSSETISANKIIFGRPRPAALAA